METDSSLQACRTPERYLKLHASNIQLLASIDSALALVTLIFNIRQVVTAITNAVASESREEKGTSNDFPDEIDIFASLQGSGDEADSQSLREKEEQILIAASVASLCTTLTQLLLACLVMVSLSYISGDTGLNHDDHIEEPRRARVIAGIWVVWSGLLLIVLLICVVNVERFKDISDKFYLFMLVSEIVLRVIIINYTTIFFCCRCRCVCRCKRG